MHDHIYIASLAAKLEITAAEVAAIADELGLKFVQVGDVRHLRLVDAAKIIRHLDRPATIYNGGRGIDYPRGWTRGSGRGVR